MKLLKMWLFPFTIDSRYIVVTYDTIVRKAQQLQRWNFGQICTHERHPYLAGRVMGCHSWVLWKKMTAIYREHSVLSQIGRYVCLGSCHATVYTTVLYSASSVTSVRARVHDTTFPREFCYFASALSVFCHFPGKSIVFLATCLTWVA